MDNKKLEAMRLLLTELKDKILKICAYLILVEMVWLRKQILILEKDIFPILSKICIFF